MGKFLLASAVLAINSISVAAIAADLPVKAPSLLSPVPEASGYVELYGGWATSRDTINATFCDPTSTPTCGSLNLMQSVNGGIFGGAARGNYWASHNVSLQLDVQAEGTSYTLPATSGLSSTSSTVSGQDWLAGGHVNWRDPSLGLLGAFVGLGDTTGVRHAVFGGEGQAYWNQYTFYFQGGYDTTINNVSGCIDTCTFDAWFLRGTGRYYFTPNLRLEGTGMYFNGSATPGFSGRTASSALSFSEKFNGWLWEAKAEWKMDNNPFAFFAKYRGSLTDTKFAITESPTTITANARMTDNRFMAGVRMYFGEKTLQWNDRQGATLDIISPLAVQSGPLYFPSASSSGPVIVGP